MVISGMELRNNKSVSVFEDSPSDAVVFGPFLSLLSLEQRVGDLDRLVENGLGKMLYRSRIAFEGPRHR